MTGRYMDDLAAYFVEVKKLDKKPDPKTYVTDRFMKMVDGMKK